MKLFKSIFWLSIAYVAIGPQVNAVDAVGELSRQTLSGGSQLIAGQIGQIECTDFVCEAGKLAAAQTLNAVPTVTGSAPQQVLIPVVEGIPYPRPPLDRS